MSIPTSVVSVDKLLGVVESFLLNPYKMMNRGTVDQTAQR